MSDQSTTRMIEMYMEDASAPQFLSAFFKSPPRNFHVSEKVEIDVLRREPRIAIPIHSLTVGTRKHENTKYVNKGYTPPIYDMETALSAFDGLKRRPGQDPFQDPNFVAAASEEAFRHMHELEELIRRAIEVQASQVLQTGVLSLVDADGVVIYALDFEPKSTHFPTTGTTWATSGATGNPLGDLASLAEVVRRDGKQNPDILIFGTSALQRFLANTDVKAQLDNRGMEIGHIAPIAQGMGATRVGFIWIGLYRFEIWGYQGEYIHPQTGAMTPFVGADNVIMLASNGRLDLTFGAIPMFVPPDARAAAFLPPRMSSPDRALDLTTNAWVTPDGKHLMLSAGTRPLTIPTAIDTFGCLDVTT